MKIQIKYTIAKFILMLGMLETAHGSVQTDYDTAMALFKSKDYLKAAALLFQLARQPQLRSERGNIHLVLGKSLLELKLPQIAAWQFVNVITMNDRSNYNKAVELLLVAADDLGDRTILNYAISKIKVSEFPSEYRDMLFFRLGEVKFEAKDYKGAIEAYEKVAEGTKYFEKSIYNIAMSYAHMNDVDNAIQKYDLLYNMRKKKGINDPWRVAALMGLARTFYQRQSWAKSLSYYRLIPRDNEVWHDALFESSWAELRSAKFRSTIGSFQSLHSDFYKDFYLPESLILRAILYLYICKYDEIQKVLSLYEASYGGVLSSISRFLQEKTDPMAFYNEVEMGLRTKKTLINEGKYVLGSLPYNVTRQLLKKGNVSNNLEYLRKLYEERKRISNFGPNFQSTSLGRYANQIIQKRIQNTKALIGVRMKGHLLVMKAELKDLNEQVGFLRYELINLEKERLKSKLANPNQKESSQIDDELDRDYYVKNGYEYYPFRGEFWLDELGNYFFLGKTSCDLKK